MSNLPERPIPAPRTKRLPGVSASTSDHLSNQSQATTRPQPTTSPTGPKAKGPHPWMTIIHPGPWTKLPPAASPLSPPGSSGQRRGWFKARVTPPNPFGESKDASRIARRRAPERPAGPAERSEATSKPRQDSDVRGRTSSTEHSNAATVSGDNGEAAPFDDPAPSGKPPGEALLPTSPHSDDSAAVSPGLIETDRVSQHESPAAGLPEELGAPLIGLGGGLEVAAMPPTSTDFPNVTGLDGSLKGGPLSGLAEGANPLNVPGAGATAGSVDTAGGHEALDFAEISSLGGLPDMCDASGDLVIVEEDRTGGLGLQMGVAGLASGLGVPDRAGTPNTPVLGSSPGDELSSGVAERGDPPGSSEVIMVPDLAELGSCLPDCLADCFADVLGDLGHGCPAVGSVTESARPRASAADPGRPSLTKSFSTPNIFSALKMYKRTPPQSPGCGGDLEPSLTPSLPKSKSNTSLASCSGRPQVPGDGFPPIRRTIRADACIPTGGLQGELDEVAKGLEKLELRSVRLECNLRHCENCEEEAAMLTDWMALIRDKQTLMRRETLIVHLMKQEVLEERQADLEYELRRLLSKPDRSPEDDAQEQRMMADLVAIIDQRNQIIRSLDEDRQREKEEDSVLEAMQKREFQKKILRELKNSRGNFNLIQVLEKLSILAEENLTEIFPEQKYFLRFF